MKTITAEEFSEKIEEKNYDFFANPDFFLLITEKQNDDKE